MNINHIVIVSNDPASLSAFYVALFEFEIIIDSNNHPESSVWLLLNQNILLMIEKQNTISQIDIKTHANIKQEFAIKNPGFFLFSLSIKESDRELWKKKINALNVDVELESEFSIYFRDPENNRIALSSFDYKTYIKNTKLH